MFITITTEYRSHPNTGAGQLRTWTRGMQRTIGYPHELNRDEGRWHAMGQFIRAWERKHDSRLQLVELPTQGERWQWEFEVFDSSVASAGSLSDQRRGLELDAKLFARGASNV